MKQIVEYYGRAILAVIAALAVVGIFTTLPYQRETGVAATLGNVLEDAFDEIHYDGAKDYAYRTYVSGSKPQIQLVENYNCIVGKWTLVEEILEVIESNGKEVEMELLSGWALSDAAGRLVILDGTNLFRCSKPGEYMIVVRATVSGRSQTVVARIFAGEEKEG